MAADDDLGPMGRIDAGVARPASVKAEPKPSRGGGLFSKLVLAAILIAAISFFAAPWFALMAVRSAAESHDNAALTELVDVGQVRASLRAQLAGLPAPAPVNPWTHPLEAMRQAFAASAPMGPSVDAYLTADGLTALLNGRPLGQPVTRHPWPRLRYWGFDRCRLAVTDPADPRRVTLLTFQRHGAFTWTLSQIRLPG